MTCATRSAKAPGWHGGTTTAPGQGGGAAGGGRLSEDVEAVAGRLVLGWALLWAMVAVLWLVGAPAAHRIAGSLLPLGVLLLGGYAASLLVTRNRFSLLTPLPLSLALVALFFGFGPLLHVFQQGSAYTTANFRIPVDAAGVFRAQLLNLVGLSCMSLSLLACATMTRRLYGWELPPAQARSTRRQPGDVEEVVASGRASGRSAGREAIGGSEPASFRHASLLRAYLTFMLIAGALRVADWSLAGGVVERLPGFLKFIDHVGVLAVFVGAVIAARKGGRLWLLPLVPLAVEVINGFLALRKSGIVVPLAFGFLGAHLGGRPRRVIAAGVVLCLCVLALIYPLIAEGRSLVWTRGGISSLDFFLGGLRGRLADADGPDLWATWTRFNYTPIQYAVMQQYDAGRPGGTYRDLPWLLVPRFVAPEKPVFDYGARLTELLFGHRHSSSSPTSFGEAYWNGGWPFVIVSALVVGAALFSISLTCLWLFRQPSVAAWAVGFAGVLMGQLVQNFFTGAFVATAVVFFWLALLVGILRAAGQRWAPGYRAIRA